MEARVDIKKLQLLNDRIVQTIDALNQVRLSVHGLSHSAAVPTGIGGFSPSISALGAINPSAAALGGMSPFAQTSMAQGVSPYAPFGLQHSTLSPFAAQALAASPYAASPYATSPIASLYAAQSAWSPINQLAAASAQGAWQPGLSGLSHSTLEEQWIAELRAQDPRRVSQTFPFAYVP